MSGQEANPLNRSNKNVIYRKDSDGNYGGDEVEELWHKLCMEFKPLDFYVYVHEDELDFTASGYVINIVVCSRLWFDEKRPV